MSTAFPNVTLDRMTQTQAIAWCLAEVRRLRAAQDEVLSLRATHTPCLSPAGDLAAQCSYALDASFDIGFDLYYERTAYDEAEYQAAQYALRRYEDLLTRIGGWADKVTSDEWQAYASR